MILGRGTNSLADGPERDRAVAGFNRVGARCYLGLVPERRWVPFGALGDRMVMSYRVPWGWSEDSWDSAAGPVLSEGT